MPRELFARSNPARPFRRSVVFLSIAAHVIVISTVLVAQILAVGALPDPRHVLGFEWTTARLTDIELPHVPAPPRPVVNTPERRVDINAAPVVPPDRITQETGNEGAPQPPQPGSTPGLGIAELHSDPGLVGAPALPPPPPPPVPVHLHSGIVAPRKTVDVAPEYPSLARQSRKEGVVIIEATIGATGAVESARILRSVALLDDAALDAVRQWKFTPALLNGVPVPVIITVTVNFRLQ